ncbi:hypothetical protein [Halorubrum sp. Hd13]|uniref:hypothetical protein n=1 Tax=Halorubrum sp. Hd13 TaxID=1480728 RepID=UPI0011403FAD|nr:hypothetical protein [Halorubrum sp. Hd13]
MSGLTDRAYLDVLGRCVSAAIVFWLLGQLAILDAGAISFGAALASVFVLMYLLDWLSELVRQTVVYAGTWRYGGPI